MKADAVNPQATASLVEFRRAVAGPHCPQIREKRAFVRQSAQNRFDLWTKANEGHFARLHARVTDDALWPVDVFGLKKSDVRLRGAEVPGQLAKRAPLGIGFPRHDALML